jgi:ribosome-associated translation inhibitor RaiA
MMKLILSTHNVTLTKTLEDRVIRKLEQLDHLDGRAVDARVTLEHDHRRMPERQFNAAIDVVAKKIEQQIRKRHSKIKARKHKDAAKLKEVKREVGV